MVGVDFVPEAIARATERARSAGVTVTFVVGDVTRLREVDVRGPFDLVIDIGCYHGIPTSRRDATRLRWRPSRVRGADFYLAGVSHPPAIWRMLGATGITTEDIRKRFGADFDLIDEQGAGHVGSAPAFTRFHLVRR
jgi:hypothetical protein